MADDKVILEIKVEDNRPAGGESSAAYNPNDQSHRIKRLEQEAKGLGIDVGQTPGSTGAEYEMRLERFIHKAKTGVDTAQERIDANNRRRREVYERRDRLVREARLATAGSEITPPIAEPPTGSPPGGESVAPASSEPRPGPVMGSGSGVVGTRSGGAGGDRPRTPRPGAAGGATGGGGGGGAAAGASAAGGAASGAAAGLAINLGSLYFATELLKTAMDGLRTVIDAINDEAELAAQFNARVAAAKGIGEARQMMGNIRRADSIASEMAEYTIQRDALLEEMRDLKASVVGAMAPAITESLQVLQAIMKLLNGLVDNPLFKLFSENFSIIETAMQALGINPALIKLFKTALKKYTQDNTIPQGELLQEIEAFLDPNPISRQAAGQQRRVDARRARQEAMRI